jgi:hypothetical protein
MSEDEHEYFDLARRLRKRFPQSTRSISHAGIVQALRALAVQGADLAEIREALDRRDQRDLRALLTRSDMWNAKGPP